MEGGAWNMRVSKLDIDHVEAGLCWLILHIQCSILVVLTKHNQLYNKSIYISDLLNLNINLSILTTTLQQDICFSVTCNYTKNDNFGLNIKHFGEVEVTQIKLIWKKTDTGKTDKYVKRLTIFHEIKK